MSDNASNLKENESINSPDTPWQCQQEPVEAFPLKWALVTRIMYVLFIAIWAVPCAAVISRGAILLGLVLTVLWLVFFGGLGLRAMFASADIMVSPQGVSRQFFGKEWKSILWNDISGIRIAYFLDVSTGKRRRTVTIDKMDYSKSKAKRRAEFWFLPDNFKNRERLIEVMNCYIKKYNIGIERKVNSKKTEYYDKL